MKHTKKLLTLLLVMVAICALYTADAMAESSLAGGECGKDLKWSMDYNGNLKIWGTGQMDNYGFWDRKDPGWKQYSDQLKTVTFDKGATTIGREAFSDCKNLKKVTLPSTLTIIESDAFSGCTALSDITLPKKLKELGSGTFENCSSLTSINLPQGMTNLGDRGYGLATFKNSGLKSVTIPSSVKKMAGYCFEDCKDLTTVTASGTDLEMGYQTFINCTNLKKVTFKKGITRMRQQVFDGCTSLTDVDLGEDLTFIGGASFNGCTALKEISIPDKVTELQSINWSYVFEDCTALEKVTLGTGLTKIGECTFKNCTSLKEVYFCGDAPQFVGNETFTGCGNLKGYYPAGSTTWDASTLTAHGAQRMDWQKWTPPLTHFTPVMNKVENINGGVKVTWKKLSGAGSYEVYRKTGNGTSSKAATLGSSATSWTDKKVSNGTRYTYTIYGVSGGVKSKVSNARYLYYLTRNTANVSSKSGILTVKWKKNSAATGYQIQYGTKASFSGAAISTANKARTVKKTLSLKKGKTYYVRVRTMKSVGGKTYYGAWSSAKKIRVK